MLGRSVSSVCLRRQVSSVLSRNCGNGPRPDVDEAWFVTVNFMARQLHALVTRTPKYRIAREVALHTVKGFTLSFAKQVLSGRLDTVIKEIERNVGIV